MGIDDLKARLADIEGIENLSMQYLSGMQRFSIGGRVINLPAGATESDAEGLIRAALKSPHIAALLTKIPDINPAPEIPMAAGLAEKPQGKPMAVTGGFAASIKAMMAEARAGVEKARSDGLSKVSEAVGKLNEAEASTIHVTSSMAKMIEDEAASVISELGLISNDLHGEAQ